MDERRVCVRCGASLRAYAAGQLCPSCLLHDGLKIEECKQPLEAGRGSNPLAASQSTSVGDYELLELIARGGMGIVYRARQQSLNRIVAVKMLLAGEFAQPKFIERFRSEAEAVARLRHPNIVAIHEIGEYDGLPFFSMDYVEGKNLATILAESGSGGRLQGLSDFQRSARWLQLIAEGVHHAHQRGVVHRDLKPSNILIDENAQPHITDFGLAKLFDTSGDESASDGQQSTITLSGEVLGSPNYLPPEQAGQKHGRVGPRSDIYSLGAILYHLITGRPPFQSESLTSLLQQVVEAEPVSPRSLNPGIPRDLETICLKCLEKGPSRRYPTAQALAEELGRFLESKPIHARPVNLVGKTGKWCRRQPVRASLVGALSLVVMLGVTGISWQWRRAERERQTALASASAELRQRQAAVAARAEAEIRQYTESLTLAQSFLAAQQFGQARETLLTHTREYCRGWEWGWLLQNCNQDLMTLSDNLALGVEAAFSPDSRLLATSGFGPEICLWDFATGKPLRVLRSHDALADMSAFSRNGRRLATWSWAATDRTACIWDMESERVLFGPLAHPDAVHYGALSRDGRRLATACADGKVRVFDATTGVNTGLVNDYGDALTAVAFSPDGDRLAYAGGTWTWVGSQDTSIRIWDLLSGKTKRLTGHSQAVYGLAWSPDGNLIVSCGWDGQVKAWDPDSGRELAPFAGLPGPPICRADFSPNGQLLGIVGAGAPYPKARATLFDVPTRRVVRELSGHSLVVQGIRFSPDGQYVATSGLDGAVKVWPVNPPPAFVSLVGHSQAVWATAFSPDGSRVATGSLDQTARIWNVTNGVLLRTLKVGFPVVSLAFSHNGERLATVGPENSACVWHVSPKSEAQTSKFDDPLLRLRGHKRAVLAVGWSPDDQWLITGSKDGTAKIWNATSGVERLSLGGHTGAVGTVAFAQHGKVVASGSADGTVRLWSMDSGHCLHVLTNHQGAVLSLAFSPTGRWLATGSSDKTARIWESDTGRPIHLLSGHINGVSSLAFSPDGQRLTTAAGGTNLQDLVNREGRIVFWDVASGHQLLVLLPHGNAVYTTAFSADGRKLVTGGADNTARIWTAFPWRSVDYPGATNQALTTRIEQYKREFWKLAIADQQAAAGFARPWTNGFRMIQHTFGEMNLPRVGSKTQPLLPLPPRPAQAEPNQIDLSGACNVALGESWQPLGNIGQVDVSLAALPAGLQRFEGITFDVRGLVQLRGGAPDADLFPDRVAILVKRFFHRFHVLHGTTWTEREGREIGAFVLHYADGDLEEVPIRYGEHLRDNFAPADTRVDCPNARLAWGGDRSVNSDEDPPRLYQATFPNPKPELEVVRIEFVSKVTRCGPFLVALTVE